MDRKTQRERIMQLIFDMEVNQEFTKEKIENFLENYKTENLDTIKFDFGKKSEDMIHDLKKSMNEEESEFVVQEESDKENINHTPIKENEDTEYINEIAKLFIDNKEEIDQLIKESLPEKWSFRRISKVDLAILRECTTELKFTELNYKISINEAINITKKYSDKDSYKFVNGVLSNILRKL